MIVKNKNVYNFHLQKKCFELINVNKWEFALFISEEIHLKKKFEKIHFTFTIHTLYYTYIFVYYYIM